jgi:hypothetical protein
VTKYHCRGLHAFGNIPGKTRGFCRALPFLTLLLLFSPRAQAQTRTDAPYLLPQTIFVGDSARLVVPLGPSFAGLAPFVWDTPEELPEAPDLVIRRIELERRGGNIRLLIDFTPFAPGALSLPALEFISSPDTSLPPFTVHVASILNPSQMTLSEPASPLAVPGTSILIYGTSLLLLLAFSLGIGGSLWGRRHFREFWERIRRRRLLRGMLRFLRRLKQECDLAKDKNPGYYLTLLSVESREFLTLFTGFNCRSLTAGEFLELPLEEPGLDPACLCRLFRAWDTLRFSGQGMEMADLFRALDEMGGLVAVLDKAEKEKLIQKPLQDTKQDLAQAGVLPHGKEGL